MVIQPLKDIKGSNCRHEASATQNIDKPTLIDIVWLSN
uniref:Uncharacterized protein n=1 Tax=Rhizophora mucronata TaxID=61149 RepID=A0A2P2NRX5_RHIMU